MREKTKLIARFMGDTIDIENQKGLFVLNTTMDKVSHELNYHNWGDLMRVVDKIQETYETDEHYGVLIDITTTYVRISVVEEDFESTVDFKIEDTTKLKATFKVVVDFIEWYNDNKPLNNNQILGQSTII